MYFFREARRAFTPAARAVGFHNFNLRIFNLRLSNPNKLIVDVFWTRCRISMCQGLGPKKHDEISEIDRAGFFSHLPRGVAAQDPGARIAVRICTCT